MNKFNKIIKIICIILILIILGGIIFIYADSNKLLIKDRIVGYIIGYLRFKSITKDAKIVKFNELFCLNKGEWARLKGKRFAFSVSDYVYNKGQEPNLRCDFIDDSSLTYFAPCNSSDYKYKVVISYPSSICKMQNNEQYTNREFKIIKNN